MDKNYYDNELLDQWIIESGFKLISIAERINKKEITVYRARKGQDTSIETLALITTLLDKPLNVLIYPRPKNFSLPT